MPAPRRREFDGRIPTELEILRAVESVVDRYFAEIQLADQLRKSGRTQEALTAAIRNAGRVPAFVDETVAEYGGFFIGSVPPLEIGCRLAAVLRNQASLEEFSRIVDSRDALQPWQETITKARAEIVAAERILERIDREPGILQSRIAKALGIPGRTYANLIHEFDLAGLVVRLREGSSYQLRVAS